MEALRDTLQKIYCPPLDTSLLAAFIAEVEAECISQNKKTPSYQQTSELGQKLSELAALTEEQSYFAEVSSSDSTPSGRPCRSVSHSSDDTPDWLSGDVTSTSCSSEASYGQTNTPSPGSPLNFLRAIFPQADLKKLHAAITRNGDDNMVAIVEELLANEYILELKERDLDDTPPISWPPIEKKQKSAKSVPVLTVQTAKKYNNRGTKIAITDVRQRRNQPPTPSRPSGSRSIVSPDPWTQLTSLSEYLVTLLPSYSPSYFQSALHSPQHPQPAIALRSCLTSIGTHYSDDHSLSSDDKAQLYAMFDILRDLPIYIESNSEQRSQILSDATIALCATRGCPDRALEIVELLLDLDAGLDLGVYHSPVSPSSGPGSPAAKSRYTSRLPSGPPPILPPSALKSKPNSPSKLQSSPFQWQSVPQRKVVQGYNPLAASIPAYNPGRKTKVKGSGNTLGKGGKGDIGELTHTDRMKRLRMGRDEALREATRYWKNGSSANRGGEVAMYFAERARDYQMQAKQEALQVAREMVMSKRVSSANGDTIDLHGTTVSEAVTIVQEILTENPSSNTNPLKIVTGRGTHSIGKIGVLKPAIKNALTEQGWDVGSFDGGLVIRERRIQP